MSIQKSILYVGEDESLFSKIEIFCEARIRTDFIIQQTNYKPGSLIEHITSDLPNIIYIDFTEIEKYTDILVQEIIFLKQYNRFRSIMFAAILPNEKNKEQFPQLFTSGFQLSMIKGMELDNFLLTSFYIGFGVKVRFPQYAQVKYIDRKLVVGICSTLTALSLDQFIIETDLETDKVKLQLSLPLFEELKATSFDISKRHRSNFIYPMTDTYYLNYPFRGAWDEETDETLDKEVLKSWFQSNHQELEQNKIFTQVITKNRALINDLFQFSLRPDYHIEISEFLDVSFLKQALPLKTPQIIFVDISETKGNSSKDDHDLKNLIGLIAIINNISNYNPILVISNNKSKSEALRKAYNYPNIIVTPEKLNVETFELLATSYSESYSSDDSSPELHYFKIMDERRAVMVDQQILVTSLSEHKVTFISEAELPIYSVLHFLLPFDFYVTIVPDLEQLVQKENVTHYTGVIHGLTESSIQNLRRFINLIYFNPLEEFTPEHIQAILGQKEIKEEIIVDIDTDKESITDEMIEEEEDNWNRTFKRPTLKGKSKL